MSGIRTTPEISQEGLGENMSNWVKNQMDNFSAWQYKQNNWFTEFNITAENAEDLLRRKYGYGEQVSTVSKFAQLHLTNAKNTADVKAILLQAIKTGNSFLKESTAIINKALANPASIKEEDLNVDNFPQVKEVALATELKKVTVACLSPKDYMDFYKALGNINTDYLNTAKEFAGTQATLRKAVTTIEDPTIKAKLTMLIDSRMKSLKIYRHYFDDIAIYTRDCIDNVTTNKDEMPSKESRMLNPIKQLRRQLTLESQDVNISISQDNDQGDEEVAIPPVSDNTDIEINKDDKSDKEERDEEQEVTDAEQAAQLDDIATAVDTLESARLIVSDMRASGQPINGYAIEALQLSINTALAKSSRSVSVPSIESLVLDRNYELNRLEASITASMEGLVDDVKIWIGKQVDTLNSKFNYAKLYQQILSEADKTASMAESYSAAAANVDAYKVPIDGVHLAYLAHAEKTKDVAGVFNSYCRDTINFMTNELSNLESAMAGNILAITKNPEMSTDDIAKDFFRKLSSFIHIDGSYIGYGWQNTIGNKLRKLFKQHMHWEPATFADDKYNKVTGVWAMHPEDIKQAVEEFKKLVQTAADFEKDAPGRREALRKAVVKTVEDAVKSTEDKATSKAIKNVKGLYLIVLDTEKEIDKYIHFTIMHMSDYLRKSASFKTIASNKE